MEKIISLGKERVAFKRVFLTLLCLYAVYICFYGSLISFFAVDTREIRDPQLPLGLKLLDETLLALMLVSVAAYRNRWINARFRIVYMLIGLLLVIAAHMGFNRFFLAASAADSYMLILKNLVYVAVVLFVFTIAASAGLFLRFLLFLQIVISASLLVGVVHYFFADGGLTQAFSSRLFGTYVNPNTAGFISIFSIVLTYGLYLSKLLPKALSLESIAVSATALYLSGSMTVFAMLLGAGVFAFLYMFMPLTKSQLTLWRRRTSLAVIATLGGLLFAVATGPTTLLERYLVKASGTYARLTNAEASKGKSAAHDATFHRFDAYKEFGEEVRGNTWARILFGYPDNNWARQDASFINMFRSVGLTGVLLFLVCLWAPIYKWLRHQIFMRMITNQNLSSRDALCWPLTGFVLVTTVFNFTTQYALEEPPTNVLAFLAVFIVALMGRQSGKKRSPA